MNELVEEKSWWSRRKWRLIAVVAVFALIVIFFIGGVKTFLGFGMAYADKPLFENAIAMVQNDSIANLHIGKIEPLDDMAIANGTVDYSEDGNKITATIPIKGSIKKAKLDVVADKINNNWEYATLKIRTKNPDREIDILSQQ